MNSIEEIPTESLDSIAFPSQRIIGWMNLIRDEQMRDKDPFRILENFWPSQVRSKAWLVNVLNLLYPNISGNAYVVGGWYGLLAQMLLDNTNIQKVYSIDRDENCKNIGQRLSWWDRRIEFVHSEAKNFLVGDPGSIDGVRYDFSFNVGSDAFYHENIQDSYASTPVTEEMVTLTKEDLENFHHGFALNDARRKVYNSNNFKGTADDVSVIINTSTEHMTQEEYDEWLELLPIGIPIILQGNNFFNCEDHIRCQKTLHEFNQLNKLQNIQYSKLLDCTQFHRFMTVGYKIF